MKIQTVPTYRSIYTEIADITKKKTKLFSPDNCNIYDRNLIAYHIVERLGHQSVLFSEIISSINERTE